VLRFVSVVIILIVAFAGAAAFITARTGTVGPSGRLVIATGGGDGVYQRMAESYRAYLEPYGIKVETRPDRNGATTLTAMLLPNGKRDVDASFLSGGFAGLNAGRLASVTEHHDRYEILTGTRSLDKTRDAR
jgi:TRAP-type uncharacterized transport system substrate-binding protein